MISLLHHRQLTELYRALRLYVNCFQPWMKLQSKVRQRSHVQRTYDQAQTPLQRLFSSGMLSGAKMEELQRVARVLDPIRLLSQLEHLQQALWRHAVKPPETNEVLRFEVKQCAEGHVPRKALLPPLPPFPSAGGKSARIHRDPMTGARDQIRLRACGSRLPPGSLSIQNARGSRSSRNSSSSIPDDSVILNCALYSEVSSKYERVSL